MKVLIVEDEIRIREGIITLLGKMGRDFVLIGEAENGEEGLALLRSLRPDIVITDIKMAGMDGLEMDRYRNGRAFQMQFLWHSIR